MRRFLPLWGVGLLLALCVSGATASGRGRHKKLYAVPVPGKVTIDAKLDDWDLSGQILSYVVPETQDMQSARTAMMYDAEALYVSGMVRDTSPMMNRHDPKTDPQKAWDADVCQLFFSLDPDMGHPIAFTKFRQGQNDVFPVGTMYLWHFTDRKEPCLAMYRGMRFNKALRPDLGEIGAIPAEHFQGAFRKMDDGGGYVFEYRIPWKTLPLTRAPKPDDILAMSMTVFWSRPDGLKTAGGAAWAYDVMSGPGFSFQNSACWGKLIFRPTGNVPQELVTEGLPPEKPLPLTFTYDLPRDSEVTVQLMDGDNQVVRLLVAQQPRRAGRNTELWDGLDGSGDPLPARAYAWKGIYHDPIAAKYRFSVHNSGRPPYPTDNNRGGWGGDHGSPSTVCAIDGGMVLAWEICEYGWGIIRTDLAGRKRWGSKHSAAHLATDGKRLFIAGGSGFNTGAGVRMLDLRDSRPVSLANGKPAFMAPEGGEFKADAVTGLAYHDGRLYVAYAARDLIAVYDANTGELLESWAVPEPRRMAVRPDGSLAVISQGKVVGVPAGKVAPLVGEHMDEPEAVAAAPDGTIYVANRGARQNVSVFDKAGKFLGSVGKQGGRPAIGRYDPSGMYMAGGIDLDETGRLWVAETTDGPKRISVWDTQTGKNVNEFFGSSSYFAYGFIDPDKPDEIYAHHVLWKIDWDNYTAAPFTTIWRKTAPNMAPPPSPSGYLGNVRIITADNGRQYICGRTRHVSLLLRRDGDLFRPFAGIALVRRTVGGTYRGSGFPLFEAPAYKDGYYFWQDANDDQTLQADEVMLLPKTTYRPTFTWLGKDLSVRLGTSHVLRPQKVTASGQPVYDMAKLQETPLTGNRLAGGYICLDPDGAVYTFGTRRGPSLIKWSPQGKMLWNYPDIIRWHNALNLPIVRAGRLWGMTGLMGVGGEYFANMSYFGVCHVFRRDGTYVAALLKDRRLGGLGSDIGQPEGQGGQFVMLKTKPDGPDRYFMVHGGQDSRVWEVLGLNTVQSLPGGTYEHTDALVAKAAEALEQYNAAIAASRRMVIARGRKALDTSEPVGKAVDSDRSFKARAAYDKDNLYVRFDVTSPHGLVNAQVEPKLVFKGGNCLDIQLGADPEADAKRTKPAPGDVRILVTQQKGKPFTVVYRPKVKGFKGEPFVFTSPTGQEPFDSIEVVDSVGLRYRKGNTGFTATVSIPLDLLGWHPGPGSTVRMDVGYIFGNEQGTSTAARAYARNSSFAAGVTNDIPNESRLTPDHWGTATAE